MRPKITSVVWVLGLAILAAGLVTACGGADAPPATASPPAAPAMPAATVMPAAPAAPAAPSAAPAASSSAAPAAPQATTAPAAPTAVPTPTPLPKGTTSARDMITLAIPEEPQNMNSLWAIGGGLYQSITRASLVDPLTWQSGDDLRIVPTTATTGWEQVAPDRWRFQLREGVKFHNGEPFNAAATISSLNYTGNEANATSSFVYTGSFSAEEVDEFTVDIVCAIACPIFPNTAFFVSFEAPEWLANTPEEEVSRQSVSIGPYRLVSWEPGISVVHEAYDDYVPVDDHFEFQKPLIRNAEWVWRGESAVLTAMVQTGEADIAWDVGVEALDTLPREQIRTGTSAEIEGFKLDTVWHPELKKKEVRQAIVHAINCQEMVDTLFGGFPKCRGNMIWPGIIGATERNTAPYEYDPDLARQLLAEAGYNPDNKMTIMGRATRIPKNVEVYEAMQGYLTDVGMNVDILVAEPSVRRAMNRCFFGKAVQELMIADGRDPQVQVPTTADFEAALAKGGADCPRAEISAGQPSNETLDFGRQVRNSMSCTYISSGICDPSPGGIQSKIAPALAASGEERVRLMEDLADILHDEVLYLPLFDLVIFFGLDPKLNWEARLDPVVRVSSMWFSP